MSKLHIVAAVMLLLLSPAVTAKFNGGQIPWWMVALAVTGLVVAAIALFLPTRKDADL